MLRTSLVLVLLLSATMALVAQNRPSGSCIPPAVPNISGQGCHLPTPEELRREKSLEKQRLHQRYLDMKRDTDKLLELATDLKKEVDSAGQETLSLDAVKKADSIEKLAKSVKQRMKGD